MYARKENNNNKNITIMKKIYLLATALAALVSCTSDEFTGDQTLVKNEAIQFESSTPKMTRAVDAAAALELGYSFYVYATKTVSTTTSNVFAHNVYSNSENTPYGVWYEASSANKTQSNTHNWEYVGTAGQKNTPAGTYTLANTQTIKYWDYEASNYVFTAYQNKSGGTVSSVTTNGFTFNGTPAQFAGLYVADKLTINTKDQTPTQGEKKNKIGNVVEFTFRSGATKVRLGIYHTIPGYEVKKVNFKKSGSATFSETETTAMLSGSFNGEAKSLHKFITNSIVSIIKTRNKIVLIESCVKDIIHRIDRIFHQFFFKSYHLLSLVQMPLFLLLKIRLLQDIIRILDLENGHITVTEVIFILIAVFNIVYVHIGLILALIYDRLVCHEFRFKCARPGYAFKLRRYNKSLRRMIRTY